ncbi:hypothetical protein AB0O64_32680 [Streptomyces sp. NPDC088341]|uniref:hypothetical protein n=1 Tax=Streptomyces sp. NPDC088341 TaxID=3154870 RepID=UPI0034169738
MDESNAKRKQAHMAWMDRWRRKTTCHLRKWISKHGHDVQRQILNGMAFKLGSGAVSLLILWAQSRF